MLKDFAAVSLLLALALATITASQQLESVLSQPRAALARR